MKFSESWLRTLVDPKLTSDELSHLLTMAGLEVEELDAVAPAFHSVVGAQVLEVVKHPDADRLNVCQVDIGSGSPQQIVCGAPNVAAGLKVPCALPGAELPGDFKIKIAKVRGIESSGMLCSAKELGIAEEASGLLILPGDAPVGQSIRQYLELDDNVFEIKLTPNRADCLSLQGIAREVGAITGAPTSLPQVSEVAASIADSRAVVLDAPAACPLYYGRVLKGVDAKAATPEWMKRRLERSGIRAISALVDITNYVMLELGQPLHAFDNAKLEGSVRARLAQPGEQLLLLNEQKITVDADILLISDDQKPLAMAGIMGGEESGVTLETTELFLESAFFAPKAIAGRARRYGFASDASHRFERGVDFGITRSAIERATQLILEICGGQAGPVVEAKAALPARQPVRLRTARAEKVLGLPLGCERISNLFKGLALSFEQQGEDFLVTPPSWRFDMEIEEDLVEEVARVYGYNNIPDEPVQAGLIMGTHREADLSLKRVKTLLNDKGYQEVITYSFVDPKVQQLIHAGEEALILPSPISSEMSAMRLSLWTGLLGTVVYNQNRQQSRVRIFESGLRFVPDTNAPLGIRQDVMLAGAICGNRYEEHWTLAKETVDFYDLKGDLEAVLDLTGKLADIEFRAEATTALHPGQSAAIYLKGERIGFIGVVHPELERKLDLNGRTLVFELEWNKLADRVVPQAREISRFPANRRDIAVVVAENVPAADILSECKKVGVNQVVGVNLFDVYRGKGVAEGYKSLAISLILQDTSRTLEEEEIAATVARCVEALKERFQASLRD